MLFGHATNARKRTQRSGALRAERTDRARAACARRRAARVQFVQELHGNCRGRFSRSHNSATSPYVYCITIVCTRDDSSDSSPVIIPFQRLMLFPFSTVPGVYCSHLRPRNEYGTLATRTDARKSVDTVSAASRHAADSPRCGLGETLQRQISSTLQCSGTGRYAGSMPMLPAQHRHHHAVAAAAVHVHLVNVND